MGQNRVRVSIGLPVYNGANYLEEALISILSQTYKNFEIIISDNGSTDQTSEICKKYAKQDQRVCYYRSEQNLGAAWNFNNALRLASGEFFKWAAHDDICAPNFLKQCVEALDQNPSAVLSYPRAKVIDNQGQLIETYDIKLATDAPKPAMRLDEIVQTWHRCYEIFGLIRTQTLRETQQMGNYAMADRVLLGELALRGSFCEVPEYLFFARMHKEQSVKAQPSNHLREVWFDTRKAGCPVFPEWRIVKGWFHAIAQSPLTRYEQIACYDHINKWIWMRKRALLQDLTRAIKQVAVSIMQSPTKQTNTSWRVKV